MPVIFDFDQSLARCSEALSRLVRHKQSEALSKLDSSAAKIYIFFSAVYCDAENISGRWMTEHK